jgi:hypothetical protein
MTDNNGWPGMSNVKRVCLMVAIIAMLAPFLHFFIKYVALSNACFAHLSEIMTILERVR